MALRLPRGTSSDDRHAVWVRVAERMHNEHLQQGWRHQLLRLVRGVFNANGRLAAEGGFLFNWMAENYLDASLMLLRRELDVQAGTENLRNLLEDIIAHPEVLTRARYLRQWRGGDDDMANLSFDSFNQARVPGASAEDRIHPDTVRQDLARVTAAGERVRVFAERTRAHRTPEQGVDRTLTFRDLHQAIADVREVVAKYYTLLTLSAVADWEPTAQYDTMAPFETRWVEDREAAARAVAAEDTPPAAR